MICSYVSCVLSNTRVVPDVKPGYLHTLLPACAPLHPEPWQQVKQDFWDKIMKGERLLQYCVSAMAVSTTLVQA